MVKHDLHEHISESLHERLARRRVVVWYDPRGEFSRYIEELCESPSKENCELRSVLISGLDAKLCVFRDSFYEVKFAVEAFVAVDVPEPLVIYLPNIGRDDTSAVLMELEAGGDRWEPQLKREGRRVLKKYFGDGQIDKMLGSPNVTYDDIISLLKIEDGIVSTGSLLEVVFDKSKGSNALMLAEWIAGPEQDSKIIEKEAKVELFDLIHSRLGIELAQETELAVARRDVSRYVLLGEFRKDLIGEAPAKLDMVPQPAKKQLGMVQDVAQAVREKHAEYYVTIADGIESDLHLDSLGIAPENLGTIDTFRFEERALLEHVGELIVGGQFDGALEIVQNRRTSFWAAWDLERQEQWLAYGLAAKLGALVKEVSAQIPEPGKTVTHWVEGYIADDGWHRVDHLHRKFESSLASMAGSISSEKVVHRIRNDYELLLEKMTTGFVSAFEESKWSIPGSLHQTEVYSKEVYSPSEQTCFILADALRYEMGVELKGLLENAETLSLQGAVGAIPTITPIGMAALMPDAEDSFSAVEVGKDLGAKINDSVMSSLNNRKKVWKGKVPDVADLDLDKVLSHAEKSLKEGILNKPLIIVRSLEIDALGESGNTFLARQVMETAINNIARAIKRLAKIGVSRFVVAADHGHLFIEHRDESQRIENPGGEQVSLHRRCWAGRGGSTASSTVRIQGSELGYQTDLDFVFPKNNSVFKAGGDLSYYHGGLSMQELLVPVLSLRMPAKKDQEPDSKNGSQIELMKVPEKIVNRIVTFGLRAEASLFTEESFSVRPVLLHKGQHVGHVGMVLDAEHVSSTQSVVMKPGVTCTVGIQLLRDDVDHVKIVVLDPETDRKIVESSNIPIKLGI